jgi:hypothetical protein
MENMNFKKSLNEQGRITGIEIGGGLVLENSQELKKELAGLVDHLSNRVDITILNAEEIDLSCIQLFIALIKSMNETHVSYQFVWDLGEDQKALLENVGLGNELYLNNSYV